MTTIQQILTVARKELSETSDTPDADSEILLSHVLGCDRTYLYTWPDKPLNPDQQYSFNELVKRRRLGEPVAYLIGSRSFWEFRLSVSPATLIPRPETELLVEQALLRIPKNKSCQVLDLGTGTGAIALAIAHERPNCEITAIELSDNARAVAKQNIEQYSQGNIQLLSGSWFSAVGQKTFDVIVSNPPYIAEHDTHLTQGDVRHEPRMALSSGADGLVDIRHIISQTSSYLTPHGWLLLEHGYNQAADVKQLFLKYEFDVINQYLDLSGQPRISVGQYNKVL